MGQRRPREAAEAQEDETSPATSVSQHGGAALNGSRDRTADHGAGGHRAAILASFLGWTLDAFDFFLVVLSGLLQEGYAAGYLLAALCYFLVFPRFGWRPMFFVGGLPALLALYVRVNVRESEVWERTRHGSWAELGRAIAAHWRLFCYLTLLMATLNAVSHGTQDMYPTFLQRDWGFTPSGRAALTALSMVGAIVGGIVFGLGSDRLGRRRAMIAAFLGGLALVPVWAFAPSLVLLVCGAVAMQFMVQGAWGVIPAH